MTTWQHTHHDDAIPGCDVEVRRDIDPATWWLEPCGCTTPTPDPASRAQYVNMHAGVYRVEYGDPTRCTCGHQLEATR